MNNPNRIQAVFLLAVEATDAAARAQVLDRECGADAELRQRVEALLAAHDASGGFLDRAPRSPISTVDDEPHRLKSPAVALDPTSSCSRSVKAAWASCSWPNNSSRCNAKSP